MKKLLSFGKSLGKEIQEDQATGLAAEQAIIICYHYSLCLFY